MHGQWQEITEQQLKELARLRRLLHRETRHLERRIAQESVSNDPLSQKAREAAMADLLRVSQVQMKIMAQEQELLNMLETARAKTMNETSDNARKELSAEDWLLLETVIRKRRGQAVHGALAHAGAKIVCIDDGENIE